jgi:hypothetical protein
MSSENPFLNLKSRSFIWWFLISIPVLLIIAVTCGIVIGIISRFTSVNLTTIFFDPLFELIVSVSWIYGLISLWCYYQTRRLKLNFKQILGKLPRNYQWLHLLLLFVPIIIFSLGTGQLFYYLLSWVNPDFLEMILKEKIFLNSSQTSSPILYNSLSFISVVFLAPLVEEFFFRGILLQRFFSKWGLTSAIIISSLFFGILHFNPVGLLMFGIMMSILYLKTRTLWIPIMIHILNNLSAILLALITQTEQENTINVIEKIQSEAWTGIILILLSAPWLIIFLYKNWTQKESSIPYLLNSMD